MNYTSASHRKGPNTAKQSPLDWTFFAEIDENQQTIRQLLLSDG